MSNADLQRHLDDKQHSSVLRPVLVWKSSTLPRKLALTTGLLISLGFAVFEWFEFGPGWVLFEVVLALFVMIRTEPSLFKTRNLSADLDRLREVRKQILPPMTAQEFLCQSMDRYAGMKTFQARVQVSGFFPHKRQIAVELPNRFRLHSSLPGYGVTTVSDGNRIIEYSSIQDQKVRTYPAPDSVASAGTAHLTQPMLGGSILYRFFAGSAGIEGLVQLDKDPIEYGASEVVEGETATDVTFYAQGLYGHVVALIGLKTGLVHRLSYDSGELDKLGEIPAIRQEALQPFAARTGPIGLRALSSVLDKSAYRRSIDNRAGWTTHEFENIVLDQPIDNKEFDTSPPDNRVPIETNWGGKRPESSRRCD